MHIAFDAKRLFNNFTGLGNYSRTLLDGLSTYFPDNRYTLYTPSVRRNSVTAPYLALYADNLRTAPDWMPGALWRTFYPAALAAEDGADVFHGLSHELPFGLDRTDVAAVVTLHDVAFRTFPKMYSRIDRLLYDRKFRFACHRADRIVAISECTKRDVMRFYGVPEEKISVIYQPVQPIFYTLPSDEEVQRRLQTLQPSLPEDYLLYVGSINSRKNLLDIVKALELIPTEERLPLVAVGSSSRYKAEVEAYVRNHCLERWVLMRSNGIDNLTLQALYRRAALFIYPSFYEGFGLPVVEAQLCECPVITSDVSCLPEASSPETLLIDPTSPRQLAHAIRDLLASPERRHRMGREGRRFCLAKFDPKRLTRQMMQVYEQALKAKRAAKK